MGTDRIIGTRETMITISSDSVAVGAAVESPVLFVCSVTGHCEGSDY